MSGATEPRRVDPSELRDFLESVEIRFCSVAAPNSTVEVGDLVLDADARAPGNLVETMSGLSATFVRTWNRERGDEFPSQSEYDMALAAMLVNAGLSDQDIVDTIIQHRRDGGVKLKLDRPDYYRRTIGNARKGQSGLGGNDRASTQAAEQEAPESASLVETGGGQAEASGGDGQPGANGRVDARDKVSEGVNSNPVDEFIPFPIQVLPTILATFVRVVSKAIGCDPSYVALPLLCAVAAAIGNTRRIRLKRGWVEPSILWAVFIGESGTQKSPALEEALRPVNERQRAALKQYEHERKQYELDLVRYECELHEWKRSKKGSPPEKPVEPIPERFICGDTTVEALVVIMVDQDRGILVARDEVSGWIDGFNQYKGGKGGDASHWLEMHGARPLYVDRKSGKPKTIYVPHAAASIVGGIQPRVLKRVLGQEHVDNGLVARLLMVYPPRRRRTWSEAEISDAVRSGLSRLFERLYALRPGVDVNGDPEPIVLGLTEGAKDLWVEFYNQHAHEQEELEGDLAAAWSKLEGYAARLALVFHEVRRASGESGVGERVDEISMAAGIALSRWFGNEARRVYAFFGQSDEERHAGQLVQRIQRLGGSVTVRRWQRSRGLDAAATAELELESLVQAGYGQWVQVGPGPKGGRPTKEFRLGKPDPDDTTPGGGGVTADVSVSVVSAGPEHKSGAGAPGKSVDGEPHTLVSSTPGTAPDNTDADTTTGGGAPVEDPSVSVASEGAATSADAGATCILEGAAEPGGVCHGVGAPALGSPVPTCVSALPGGTQASEVADSPETQPGAHPQAVAPPSDPTRAQNHGDVTDTTETPAKGPSERVLSEGLLPDDHPALGRGDDWRRVS